MKKSFFAIVSLALLFVGCSEEPLAVLDDTVKVNVTTLLQNADQMTRAALDNDGLGAQVDHWVVEVRDSLTTNTIYYHGEKSGTKGVLQQTFELYLVKEHTYYIAFWADKAGSYQTSDLTAVECTDVTKIGNSDDFDGFFKCIRYKVTGDAEVSAQLYRPFAQVNIITNDLPRLQSTTTAEAYAHYEPVDYTFKLTVPTAFSAFTGAASAEQEITIVPTEAVNNCYGDYAAAGENTTVFMTYLLTNKPVNSDSKDVRNIDFTFKSGSVKLDYDLQNIPLKRNYRTNIIGSFMTNTLKWEIEVVPTWAGEIPENKEF